MFDILGRPNRTSVMAASAIAMVASIASAQAQEQVRTFDIPAQPLSSALIVFARQSEQMVLADPALVNGRQAPAVQGNFTPTEALQRLLVGTGLSVTADANGSFVLADPSFPTRLGAVEPAAPSDGAGAEEIIVTGTRIRGVQNGASPSVSLDREDFEQAGATTVQQMMQTLPQNFTGGYSETAAAISSTRNGNSENFGYGAGINLRGLGNGATLVLLNGRRLAPGAGGATVDVSTIPLSALSRIDVLPDGASAIYGSDAVGGVVNFILRDDYQGSETSIRYGSVTDGGLRDFSANHLLGAAWSSGSVMANLDYGRREPLLASERSFASALAGGPTYLSADDERIGVLLSGRQSLSPNFELSLTAFANARDVHNMVFQQIRLRQLERDSTTEQMGATAAATWDASPTWRIVLAHTYSETDTSRLNINRATATLPEQTSATTTVNDTSITEFEAEGALFSLPGGSARLATGAEHRTESLVVHRSGFGGSGFGVVTYQREVDAAYAELLLPLLPEGGALGDRLDVTAALRHEEYSDVGSATNSKFGIAWTPFDGLRLRATHGTSFRAPYLFQYDDEQIGGILFNAPNPASPTGTTLLAYIVNAPSPDLEPANATTWTAGFDLSQRTFGVDASLSYFNILYEDRIIATAPRTDAFFQPLLLPLISMPPDPVILAALATVPASNFSNLAGMPLSAAEATFDGRVRNQASTDLSGIDLNVSRRFGFASGDLTVGFNTSYLLQFENQQVSTVPAVDILNTIYNPVALRVRGNVGWTSGGLSLSAFLNYVDEYEDNQTAISVDVSSWTTVDLSAAYSFGESSAWLDGLTLRFNAINAFDEDPPLIIDRTPSFGNPGYDTENANPLGRIVSFQVIKRW